MAPFGKVLDLLNERYLTDLHDVVGNVEPFPVIVPYAQYNHNALVYRTNESMEEFLGIIQDFTDRKARETGKELWTWYIQWDVETQETSKLLATPHTPKKARTQTAQPEEAETAPEKHLRHSGPVIDIIERRILDLELIQEEDMLRTLIDIVQVESAVVPNFIEFLYRWIDYYEGDGTALKAALYWEIPSLWDFDYHPRVLPDNEKDKGDEASGGNKNSNNSATEVLKKSSPTLKMRTKPDLAALEQQYTESERLQYREVKFGMQPPKLDEPLPPLINIPREQKKRMKYYFACFRSRQRAYNLLLQAGLTTQQISNYTKMQKEHPRDTPQEGHGTGLRNYQKDALFAQTHYVEKEEQMALFRKKMEITISNKLALEAQIAAGSAGDSLNPSSSSSLPSESKSNRKEYSKTSLNVKPTSHIAKIPEHLKGLLRSKAFEGESNRREKAVHANSFSSGDSVPPSLLQEEEEATRNSHDVSQVEPEFRDTNPPTVSETSNSSRSNILSTNTPAVSSFQHTQMLTTTSLPSIASATATNMLHQQYQPVQSSDCTSTYPDDLMEEYITQHMSTEQLKEALSFWHEQRNQRQENETWLPSLNISNNSPFSAPMLNQSQATQAHQAGLSRPQVNFPPYQPGMNATPSTQPANMRSFTPLNQLRVPPPPVRNLPPLDFSSSGTHGWLPSQMANPGQMQSTSGSLGLNSSFGHAQNSHNQRHHLQPAATQNMASRPQYSPPDPSAPHLEYLTNARFEGLPRSNFPLSQNHGTRNSLTGGPFSLDHYSLSSRRANRPSPLCLEPNSPFSTLTPNLLATSPFQPTFVRKPINVLIYLPKALYAANAPRGAAGGYETDALMLGTCIPGSGMIEVSRVILLPMDVWERVLARVARGRWDVLESYPSRPLDQLYASKLALPPPRTCIIPAHKAAYDVLVFAHSLMQANDREAVLTKRWRITPGPMHLAERGAIWEGWGLVLDRPVRLGKADREGAVIRDAVVDGKKPIDPEEEWRRKVIERWIEEDEEEEEEEEEEEDDGDDNEDGE